MHDLDKNNPMIFGCSTKGGRIQFDMRVVSCAIQLACKDKEPPGEVVVRCMRENATSLEADRDSVAGATDAELYGAFARAADVVNDLGKGAGRPQDSSAGSTARQQTSPQS